MRGPYIGERGHWRNDFVAIRPSPTQLQPHANQCGPHGGGPPFFSHVSCGNYFAEGEMFNLRTCSDHDLTDPTPHVIGSASPHILTSCPIHACIEFSSGEPL